jgi:Fe2+ transport system protein FeoA
MNQPFDLNQSATGFHGLIARIGGDKSLKRKLMSLGIRQGQEISVLHQRKNGVVVLSNGSRVALGSGIAANVFLEPLPDQSSKIQV